MFIYIRFILSFVLCFQILILWIIPAHLGASGANYAKNLLRAAVLFQYIPKLYRLLPFLAGQTPTGFIFESAWANFVINLLTFMLAGHVVGSCWYLFGLQVWTYIIHFNLMYIVKVILLIVCFPLSFASFREWINALEMRVVSLNVNVEI